MRLRQVLISVALVDWVGAAGWILRCAGAGRGARGSLRMIIAHDLGEYFRTRSEVSSEMDERKPASIAAVRVDREGEHSAP